MNELAKSRVAETLNGLTFVRWDRLVETDTSVDVYGWIPRSKDSRSDFVLLTFDGSGEWTWWTTSSVEFEQAIIDNLDGASRDTGFACQRVEHVFGELVEGAIRL